MADFRIGDVIDNRTFGTVIVTGFGFGTHAGFLRVEPWLPLDESMREGLCTPLHQVPYRRRARLLERWLSK